MPFDEENLIIRFWGLRTEDACEHIDTTPTSFVTALESFCELNTHYFQTNANDGMEMGPSKSDDDSNGGDGIWV